MITGKFVREKENRFLCLVDISNKQEECYVSSSSKLKNYINLNKKTVLLVPNKGKRLRTKYTLQAAKVNNVWMLLNLNYVNDLMQEFLLKKYGKDTLYREHYVKDYKTDFYVSKKKLIIEAKGILANKNEAVYPLVSCGRTQRQLKEMLVLLKQGYKVEYCFIIMNPHINNIRLNDKEKDAKLVFKKCIAAGMKIKYFKTKFYNGKCSLKELKNEDISIT